jgi:hypothetical protein
MSDRTDTFRELCYFIRICCTPDILLPSRKRRVINLKTIHRGKNQLGTLSKNNNPGLVKVKVNNMKY